MPSITVKRRKHIASTLAVLALTSALLTTGEMSANATPYNCSVSGTGLSRSALCLSGTGSYRIKINCNAPLDVSSRVVYGPYMSTSSGTPSVAWCDWYEHVGGASVGVIN